MGYGDQYPGAQPEQRYDYQQQPQGQPWYMDAYNGLRGMFGLDPYQAQQQQQQAPQPVPEQSYSAAYNQQYTNPADENSDYRTLSQTPGWAERFNSGVGGLRDLGSRLSQGFSNFKQDLGDRMQGRLDNAGFGRAADLFGRARAAWSNFNPQSNMQNNLRSGMSEIRNLGNTLRGARASLTPMSIYDTYEGGI